MESSLESSLERDRGIGADRVREHTAAHVKQRLDADEARRVQELAQAPPDELRRRAAELDREWDVDRALMANFAIVGGIAFALGVRRMRRSRGAFNGWLGLLSIQLPFLLTHAIVGWCPPLPVFRRLGFRTAKEIARERDAVLRLLRYRDPSPPEDETWTRAS